MEKVTIILPYVEENEMMLKAVDSIKKYTDESKYDLLLMHDEKREGTDVMFSRAFKMTTGDVILWHTDVFATPNWLENLKYEIKLLPERTGIIGCKLIYPNKSVQHYGGYLTNELFPRHIGIEGLNNSIVFTHPIECDFVTFGGCYIKREVIDKIGDMDKLFYPTYFGDVDYCLQACWDHHFLIYVVPVELIHLETQDNKKVFNERLNKIMFDHYSNFKYKWQERLK